MALVMRFDVNLRWLLTGKGSMLSADRPRAVAEDEAPYYIRESPKGELLDALRGAVEALEASAVMDPGELRDLARRAEAAERAPPPVIRAVAGGALPPDDARAVEDETELLRAVPILDGRIAAGVPMEVAEAERVGWAFCYAPHVPHPERTSCIRVAGDSMAPVIPDGALVGIDHAMRDVREMTGPAGEPTRAAIRVEEDEGCVVRNVRLAGGRILLCEPENDSGGFPRFEFDLADPDLPNPVIGRVIWWYVSALSPRG